MVFEPVLEVLDTWLLIWAVLDCWTEVLESEVTLTWLLESLPLPVMINSSAKATVGADKTIAVATSEATNNLAVIKGFICSRAVWTVWI